MPSEEEIGIIDYGVAWASGIKEEFLERWSVAGEGEKP